MKRYEKIWKAVTKSSRNKVGIAAVKASIVIGHFFNIQGLHARFPKIGLPPVIIHLSFGFSHGNQASLAWGSTHQNGNHPWCQVTKRFPKAVPRITHGWICSPQRHGRHGSTKPGTAMARGTAMSMSSRCLGCYCPTMVCGESNVAGFCSRYTKIVCFV